MTAGASAPPRGRLSELDALRVIAFGLLILYHVGMFYVPWDWVVKSPRPVPALEPLMRLSSPWRLALLFLVAGASLRLMLASSGRSVRSVMTSRSKRLLLPLAFGVLVAVPPQAYLEVVEKLGYTGSYLDFMARYLRADNSFCRASGGCLVLPTWNHLWFVAYAWVYTMLALALAPVLARKLTARPRLRLGQGTRLLWLPWLGLAGIRIGLAPLFPSTHDLMSDWANHALFGSMFAIGWMLFGHADDRHGSWRAAERLRWPALLLALTAWGVLTLAPSPASLPAAALRSIAALTQWLPIVAALGFARRHLHGRDGPLLRHLGNAVFPCYILHQTITVVAGHHLARLGWPQPLEAGLLVALTLGGSWAGYLVIRRLRVLRPWFGLASVQASLPWPTHSSGQAAQGRG